MKSGGFKAAKAAKSSWSVVRDRASSISRSSSRSEGSTSGGGGKNSVLNPMSTAGKDNAAPIGKKKMSFGTLMRKAVAAKRAENDAPLPEEKDDEEEDPEECVTQITSAEDPDDFDLDQIIPTPSLLKEKQDTAKLEHNIKGLTSANARRRRQSHKALISDFQAAKHKPRHQKALTSGGGIIDTNLLQMEFRMSKIEEKLKCMDSIERKLDRLLALQERGGGGGGSGGGGGGCGGGGSGGGGGRGGGGSSRSGGSGGGGGGSESHVTRRPSARSSARRKSAMPTTTPTHHKRISTQLPNGWAKHQTEDGNRYYSVTDSVTGESTTQWVAPKDATGGSTGRLELNYEKK